MVSAGLMHPASSFGGETKKSKNDERSEMEISPVEDLMREHGVLTRILLIYDEIISRLNRGVEFPPVVLANSAGLIRRFVEDYHEKLEENQVFPRFEKAGRLVDLVRVLLEQHQAGRLLTDQIRPLAVSSIFKNPDKRKQLIQYLRLFIRMYRPHKAREDTVLFPAFHSVVSAGEFDALGDTFEEQEEKLFGQGGFEKVVEKVATLERTLGIYDLAQFAPR
jgi:hemerythrin-like domain-containing protein